jgi:hypothetical protein
MFKCHGTILTITISPIESTTVIAVSYVPKISLTIIGHKNHLRISIALPRTVKTTGADFT